tara:strand:- start:776 stop:1246 length:471 start_codon:yes stop_codon:yes gene_type:complete
VKSAILHCIRVVDVVDANGHTLSATVLRSENIFNIFDLEDAHSVVGDGRTLCVLVAHRLTCKQGSKVDWVSGKGEVFVLWYHKENITQGWVRVKGDYTKAIKKVRTGGIARIQAVPQKLNTSMFLSSKIEVTHMIIVPPIRKGRITESKEGIGLIK